MKKSVVTYAKFHQGIFIPHLGELGVTLPSSSKTIPDLAMHTEEEGMVIRARGISLLVPYGNIVLMALGAPYFDDATPTDLRKAVSPKS